jgi:uridine kinase
VRRSALLDRLAGAVVVVSRSHPLRVAVDGPDCAGKTTLADELAVAVRAQGRPVIRASIDGFHRPRRERYRQGPDSPVGYYEDSFDLAALREVLLEPLGPGGSRRYRRAVFDYRNDRPRTAPPLEAPEDAVLLVDGVFLRPELAASWDVRLFVSVAFDECLRRALDRDTALFGTRAEVESRYRSRYIPAQEAYLAAVRPTTAADLVIHNDDPASPRLEEGTAADPQV